MTPPSLPDGVRQVADALVRAGGRPFLVGGGVRDHLRGLPVVDWDLEVFGLHVDEIAKAVRSLGRVDAVGKAFGVLKARPRGWQGADIDVSLPRRDSKQGPGHRGIVVSGDPFMSHIDAARRRDLTINAMSIDLGTGDLVDPFGGASDLRDGVLRAVDSATFLEDPLRALRVAQFAARFDFEADRSLVDLCRTAALDELPAERVGREWAKLWLAGLRPSRGLRFARDAELLAHALPALVDVPLDDEAADRWANQFRTALPAGRRWAAALALWLRHTPPDRREAIFDRLDVHSADGVAVRRIALALLDAQDMPLVDDRHLRHISARCDLRAWLGVRGALDPAVAHDAWIQAADMAGIADAAPAPLLRGRDLTALGVPAGPAMGALLARLYQAQLDGEIGSEDAARALARRWARLPNT